MSGSTSDASPSRLLLDTHVFIWWADGEQARLSGPARAAVAAAPIVFVSLATAWELTTKSALAKLRLGVSFTHALELNRFVALPITLDHVDALATLPAPPRHRDPFDRMLIAQAAHEGLTLVTHDRAFRDYPVPVLWA